MTSQGFAGEEAVEGRTADAELARGAEFVAVIEIEDHLNVAADCGVQGEICSVS